MGSAAMLKYKTSESGYNFQDRCMMQECITCRTLAASPVTPSPQNGPQAIMTNDCGNMDPHAWALQLLQLVMNSYQICPKLKLCTRPIQTSVPMCYTHVAIHTNFCMLNPAHTAVARHAAAHAKRFPVINRFPLTYNYKEQNQDPHAQTEPRQQN